MYRLISVQIIQMTLKMPTFAYSNVRLPAEPLLQRARTCTYRVCYIYIIIILFV
jgi:hypothetical protein